MRFILLLSAAVSTASAAPTLESLKEGSLRFPLPAFHFTASPPQEPPDQTPVIQQPSLEILLPTEQPGAVIGRMSLAAQLDRHRDLLTRTLGGSTWDISAAGDAAFKNYYLTFRQGQRLVIAPLGNLGRLVGEGVDVTLEPGLTYNIRLAVNLFNPVRGSTLQLRPVGGTRGPSHDLKTSEVLDLVKARSFVFSHGGVEYWTLYGTDIDASGTLAGTRSSLFIQMNGLKSKLWPVSEGALPLDRPSRAALAQPVVLTRSASELVIRGAP